MDVVKIPRYLANRLVLSINSGTALKMMLALVSMRQDDSLEVKCDIHRLADVCGVTVATVDHAIDSLARASFTDFNHVVSVFDECFALLPGRRKRDVEVKFSQAFTDILKRDDGYITIEGSEFIGYRSRAAILMRLRFTLYLGNKKRVAFHATNDDMTWLIGYKSDRMSHAVSVGILPGVEEINFNCHAFTVDVRDRRRGLTRNAKIGRLDFDIHRLVSKRDQARLAA
jgi:hypothetical protein